MEILAAAAALAFGEVLLVVLTHFRSQAGDVIAPSRKDLPYDGFHALAHKKLTSQLEPDGRDRFRLGCEQETIVPKPLTAAQGLLRRGPRDFGMIILFREMRQYYVLGTSIIVVGEEF